MSILDNFFMRLICFEKNIFFFIFKRFFENVAKMLPNVANPQHLLPIAKKCPKFQLLKIKKKLLKIFFTVTNN